MNGNSIRLHGGYISLLVHLTLYSYCNEKKVSITVGNFRFQIQLETWRSFSCCCPDIFTLRANKNIRAGGKIRLIENNVLQEYAEFDFMTAAMEIIYSE